MTQRRVMRLERKQDFTPAEPLFRRYLEETRLALRNELALGVSPADAAYAHYSDLTAAIEARGVVPMTTITWTLTHSPARLSKRAGRQGAHESPCGHA